MKLKSGAITLTAAATLLAATAFAQNQSGTQGQSAQDQGAQGQQMPGQTQPGQAQGGMEASTPSPGDVRQIQQALKDKGFDAGPIDGQLGPQTEQALRSFQQAQGFQATGQIDQKTMAALGVQAGQQSMQGATPPQGTQAQGGGVEQGAGGAATSAPSTTESMPGGQSSQSPTGATTR